MVLYVGIDFHPARSGENILHGGFRAENHKIHHVARVAGFVTDAAGNFFEERIIDAGQGSHIFCDGESCDSCSIRGNNFDVDSVRAVASVVLGLVDGDAQAAADWHGYVLRCAEEERLRDVSVADATDQRAASGSVVRKNAQKILEAAGETVGAVIFLGVGVAHNSFCGGDNVFAWRHLNAGVEPVGVALQRKIFGNPSLCAGRRKGGDGLGNGQLLSRWRVCW